MAFLINEEKYINDNVFRFEDRINSQIGRFIDKSPSYTTYYSINSNESSVDLGFQNVEKVLGEKSPIRFNKVKGFPIYGIDEIVIDLQMDDGGLDGSFESGEGIILPNTLIPQPNDFFTISYLDNIFTFMVTEIKYDTIRSNNFYKIAFVLKSVNDYDDDNLKRQTIESYTCFVDNIGTKDQVIIRDDVADIITAIDKALAYLRDEYINLFYNKKYNVLLFNMENGYKLYDAYQTKFINDTKLFEVKDGYNVLRLSEEDNHTQLNARYRKSVYGALENRDKNLLQDWRFWTMYLNNNESIFTMYNESTIRTVHFLIKEELQGKGYPYLKEGIYESIMNPPKPPSLTEFKVVTKQEEFFVGDNIIKEDDKPSDTTLTEEEIKEEIKDIDYVENIPEKASDGSVIFDPSTYVEDDDDEEDEKDVPDNTMMCSAEIPLNEPKDFVPVNETNMIEPIVPKRGFTLKELDEVEIPKVKYDSIFDEFIIKFFNGEPINPFEFKTDDIMEYARSMEYDLETFINIPILMYIVRFYRENLSQ